MDKRTAKKMLTADRDRLTAVLESLRQEASGMGASGEAISVTSSNEQHPADVGSEVFEFEKGMSIRNNVEAELADIERAMQRLHDGTYGVCEACGQRIPQPRLQAKPSARFCVKDQARAEREARIA